MVVVIFILVKTQKKMHAFHVHICYWKKYISISFGVMWLNVILSVPDIWDKVTACPWALQRMMHSMWYLHSPILNKGTLGWMTSWHFFQPCNSVIFWLSCFTEGSGKSEILPSPSIVLREIFTYSFPAHKIFPLFV